MLEIYDTTLRDGMQRKGIDLSCNDKIRVAQRLDKLGIHYIEGGWPGSNPKDIEFFERARDLPWRQTVITAFGSTCRPRLQPEEDANIKALLDSSTTTCTIFGKSWTLHVTEVLRTTLEENLRIIQESCSYLVSQGRRVIYDGEHFFDGYKADPSYAIETLNAAVRGGAETLVLCDTNGGTMPWELDQIFRDVKSKTGHPIGIHAHNDSDFGVANTIAAFQAGAVQIQGTFNGYGERCGNANLCSVIPIIELKLGVPCLPEGNLKYLSETAHFISELANLAPDEHLPYVGKAAFAHKGGVHVAAMRRNEQSYQHINPELVGNQMVVIVSELSGRGNLLSKAEEFGLGAQSGDEIKGVLDEIKNLESQGYAFEAAEASVALMMKRQKNDYEPPFELIDFSVNVEHRDKRGMFAEATVKVRVNGRIYHTAAEGDGPVNALDMALRKALTDTYPQIDRFHLADYKVRILDGDKGTKATTRVLIDTKNGTKSWSTVGASANIIEASWYALADSVEYGLLELNTVQEPEDLVNVS
jgi:2-isopropylmalate synthase